MWPKVNRTRTTVLWCFAVVCICRFSAFSATINLAVKTDQVSYRLGDTVSWTIYAWASKGDNRGVALLSVHLDDDRGETLSPALLGENGFQDTAYGTDMKYLVMGEGTVADQPPRLRNIMVIQLPWEKHLDVGNDGNSNHILAKGQFVVTSPGKHELRVILNAANYWPDDTSNAAPFEFKSELQASFVVMFPEVLYVDSMATDGMNTGVDWDNALLYLQDALSLPANSSGVVTEITVAQGTYTPDANSVYPNGTGDRTATFQLINGVAIRGGYAGFGEPDPNERDPNIYETILSGDIGIPDDNSDNCYHVFYHPTSINLNSTAVLDGFSITGGNAEVSNGGGMYNDGTNSPTVNNCVFSGNLASKGGGMYNYYDSAPTVTDCTFSGNSANKGGGMYIWSSGPIVTNCTFIGNSADGGGGMYNEHDGHPTITNSTFSGNSAQNGGSMYNISNSNPTVTNCILWDNTYSSSSQIYSDGSSSAIVTYSDVQGDGSGTGNIDVDPCFVEPGYWDVNGTPSNANDDFWVGGDYHLKSQARRWDPNSQSWIYDEITSPCIDAGNPNSDWAAELWPHGKRINMGAYGGTTEASMSQSNVGNIADLDCNDYVDYNDLRLFTEKWPQWQVLLAEDLDRNGNVDFHDFGIFAENWKEKAGAGLVGHWKFDEGSGQIAYDSSGYGNDGQLGSTAITDQNDPKWVEDPNRGWCLDFDGGDYVKTEETTNGLDFAPHSFSASAWIWARQFPGEWNTVMEYERWGTDRNWFGLWVHHDSSGKDRFHFRVGGDTKDSNGTLKTNEWYLLTGTYDSTSKTMSLYINGQLDTSRTHSKGFSSPSAAKLTIGVYGWEDAEYFDGLIDDVRIYDYALSEYESPLDMW